MRIRSFDAFRGRVLLGLGVVAAYLVLLLGLTTFSQWQAHRRLRGETEARARAAAETLAAAQHESLVAALRGWATGAAPRQPQVPRDLQRRHLVAGVELLSPGGWSLRPSTGTAGAQLGEAGLRRLQSGEILLDDRGMSDAPEYAVLAALRPVLDENGALLGVLRVEVSAEPLAISALEWRMQALIHAGSTIAFVALLFFFGRWALRPLALLDEAARDPEAAGDELARADDTGFAIETYRRMIAQLREKESELRRLRELERHRADELQELNETIVSSMLAGAVVLDMSGSIRSMNDAAKELLRIGPEERVTGRPHAEVLRGVPELAARIGTCLRSGAPLQREELRVNLAGFGRRDVDLSIAPLRGDDGAQRGALALLTDLTEVKRLQEEMRLRESMAELGELSAGVAHEFRNSLATILGYARLVEKNAEGDVADNASAIAAECNELRKVVDDFLRFANPARLVIEPVDLGRLLQDLGQDVAQRCGDRRVRYETAGELPVVSGDETLLRRAFTNLVRNACDAAPEGGLVRASGEMREREVLVHVDDDGPGIPVSERSRVFVPFFTRKEHGTGLGLALARKVVVHHGGRLTVDDSPLGGARLTVALPWRRPPMESADAPRHEK